MKEEMRKSAEMLFYQSYVWFRSLHITYTVGVDGIAVAMIALTSVVVFAGIFASWEVHFLPKNFSFLLYSCIRRVRILHLPRSVYYVLVLRISSYSNVPADWFLGQWTKRIFSNEAYIDADGWLCIIARWFLGIYFNSAPGWRCLTFNILSISKMHIPIEAQRFFFPLTFLGFGVLGALFPFHTWSPDGHASAPTAVSMLTCRRTYETRRIWLFQGCNVSYATSCSGIRMDIYYFNNYQCGIWLHLEL